MASYRSHRLQIDTETAREYEVIDDPLQETDTGAEDAPTKKAWMVDWKQAGYSPVACFFTGIAVVVLLNVFNHQSLAGYGFLACIVASPIVLLIHLWGYVFDPVKDRLSYPLYFIRRRLPLSELSDANCQSYSRTQRTSGIDGSSASRIVRHYAVNLSGSFGARRAVFFSKYKRDQFLSLVRAYAPQARITRWR
jgi:hypothetical protein